MILGHHGCSTLGDTVEMAYRRALNLEEAANAPLMCASIGNTTATFPPADHGKHVATVTDPPHGTLAEPAERHAPHVCFTPSQGELPPAPPGY